MARLRKGIAYRRLERPYTRISKFKKKSFIKTTYNTRITRFVMGNLQKELDFPVRIILQSKTDLQIRDNALESARLTSNKVMEGTVGSTNYFPRVNKYPHHILRLHALASGAGADRFSTGMAHSFGKPDGQAAQFRKGDIIMEVRTDKKNVETAKKALRRAYTKLPTSCLIIIENN